MKKPWWHFIRSTNPFLKMSLRISPEKFVGHFVPIMNILITEIELTNNSQSPAKLLNNRHTRRVIESYKFFLRCILNRPLTMSRIRVQMLQGLPVPYNTSVTCSPPINSDRTIGIGILLNKMNSGVKHTNRWYFHFPLNQQNVSFILHKV